MQHQIISVNIVNETAALHDGSGTGVSSSPVVGEILAIDINIGSEQTATLDITIATNGNTGKAVTLYSKSNSATDVRVQPRVVVHDNGGTGVTYDGTSPIYDKYAVADHVTVTLAGADNESPACVCTIFYR